MSSDIAEFRKRLAQLEWDSETVIGLLTVIAQDSIGQARDLVNATEEHLLTVEPKIKVCVFNVIDSIVKTVKGEYSELFARNIDSTFTALFGEADVEMRDQLLHLRLGWDGHFPPEKLHSIDVQCHQVDPSWPILTDEDPVEQGEK